jgi:hypothetical protein
MKFLILKKPCKVPFHIRALHEWALACLKSVVCLYASYRTLVTYLLENKQKNLFFTVELKNNKQPTKYKTIIYRANDE